MGQGQYSLADVEQPKGQFSLNDIESSEPDRYQPGALHAIGEDLTGLVKGLGTFALGPPGMAYQSVKRGLDTYRSIKSTGKTPEMLQNEGQKQAGYGPVYRYVSTPLAQGVGVNVPAMEESAAHGDIRGVLGRTVVPAAAAATPLVGEGLVKGANRIIPSYERAGKGLGAMDKQYADLPINPQQSYALARELVDKMERTGNPVPPQLRAFAERVEASDVAARHPEVARDLQAQGIETSNPLTFPEAREFRTAINALKFDKAYSPVRAQLGEVARRLDMDIRASSPHDAFLKDYSRFNKEYARASKIERGAEKAGSAIGATAGTIGGYELGQATGVPHAAWVGGGIGYKLGEPVIGSLTRKVLGRSATAPKLTEPPAVPAPTPEAPAAPLALKPGQYAMPPSPLEGEVLPPSAVTPRATRITPEQYTRLMLRAKEGEISPTRFEQLMNQLGGPKMKRIK